MRQNVNNSKLSNEEIFKNQYNYVKEIEWFHDFGELTIHSLAGIKYRKATGQYSSTMSREDLHKSLIDSNNYAMLLRALDYSNIGLPKGLLPAGYLGLSVKYSNLLRLVKSLTDNTKLPISDLEKKQTPGVMPGLSALDNFKQCVMQFYNDTDFFTAQGKNARSAALRLVLDSREPVRDVFFAIIEQKKSSIKYIECLFKEIRNYQGKYNEIIPDDFLVRLDGLGYEVNQLAAEESNSNSGFSAGLFAEPSAQDVPSPSAPAMSLLQ